MANIGYKFVKMELTQFSPNHENYKDDGQPANVSTGFEFGYNSESRILRCTDIFQFAQENRIFLNAELQTYFEIQEDSLGNLVEDNKLTIPTGLLCQFASLGYGAFRGILYLKAINTPYSDIVLPPLYINDIIKDNLVIDLKS